MQGKVQINQKVVPGINPKLLMKFRQMAGALKTMMKVVKEVGGIIHQPGKTLQRKQKKVLQVWVVLQLHWMEEAGLGTKLQKSLMVVLLGIDKIRKAHGASKVVNPPGPNRM